MLRHKFSTACMKKYYDIVIAGGGMVGSVLACKLARNPALRDMSILLIENTPRRSWNEDLLSQSSFFSNRVSALNNATKSLLESVDIWNIIEAISCRTVHSMKIWSITSNNISATFSSSELSDLEAMAYIVENKIIVAACMKLLEEKMKGRIDILHGTPLSELSLPKTNDEGNVVIRLSDNSYVECELLLGTDGANSRVRQSMGVQYLTWNYNQNAVVATLEISENEGNHTAWQRFLTTGPVALLPLADNYSSLVWTTTPVRAKQLLNLSPEFFVDALNTAFWEEPIKDTFASTFSDTFSSVLKVLKMNDNREHVNPPTVRNVIENSRTCFPLGFGHAVSYVAPKVALVGDAAHRVHPLAGQGVNLGFSDINCLDSILTKCVSHGAKLGDIHYLRYYETDRQRFNVPKQIGIDLIQKVAGHPSSPLIALTNVGFQVTNAIPQLKKFLVKTATSY